MKKVGIVLLAFLASVSFSSERKLNIYNWSDYIDNSVLEDFTKKTNIEVVYDVFDSNEILETKLLSGKTGYDIVVPSHNFLSRQIRAGVFKKLDKDKIPNIKGVDKSISEKTTLFDPNNDYSVNYMWGTAGFGINENKVYEALPDAPVNSLELIFNPVIAEKLSECGIYWLDTPEVMLPLALLYLGFDANSQDKEEIKKAFKMMSKVRHTVKKFEGSEYVSSLANGDICIAVGYNGDVIQARERAKEAKNGIEISYHIPKEGSQLWFDQLAIPEDAENIEEAYEFINFILEPKNIARLTNYIGYPNSITASKEFVDKEVLDDKSVYPDDKTIKNLFISEEYERKIQRLINRLWSGLLAKKK